jgi:hypothetical protein
VGCHEGALDMSVLTNRGVANAFVNGREARNSRNSLSSRAMPNGTVALHSYEEVIAVRIEDSGVTIVWDNRTRYSISTSTHHMPHLRRAVLHPDATWTEIAKCRRQVRKAAGLDPDAPRTVIRRGRHTYDRNGNRLQRAGW